MHSPLLREDEADPDGGHRKRREVRNSQIRAGHEREVTLIQCWHEFAPNPGDWPVAVTQLGRYTVHCAPCSR